MSRMFFDHLINLSDLEDEIKTRAETSEEKEELWAIIDEIVHHKVLGCIFDTLPHEHHDELLTKIHESPHDRNILSFLNEKVDGNIEEIIKQEIGNLAYEILQDIK